MKLVIIFLAFWASAVAFPFNNDNNVTTVPTFVAVSDNDVNYNNNNNDNVEYEYHWDVDRHHNDRRSLSNPKNVDKAMNAGAGFLSYAGKKIFGGKFQFILINLYLELRKRWK